MKMRSLLLLSLFGIAGVVSADAVQVRSGTIPNRGIFAIKVDGTNQAFYGRAERINSVSLQEYTTGPLLVTEVVIDLENANQALRIYSARPMSSADAKGRIEIPAAGVAGATVALPALPTLAEGVEKQGQKMSQKALAGLVVKTYPVTTHAKMTEISVGTREEVVAFYEKFTDLWANREVAVTAAGVTSSAKGAATAAGAAGGVSNSSMTVNRIGGVLFVIE